jgi:hypothetical protein
VNKQSIVGAALALSVLAAGCVGPFAPHQASGKSAPAAVKATRTPTTANGEKQARRAKKGGPKQAAAGGTPLPATSPQPAGGQ